MPMGLKKRSARYMRMITFKLKGNYFFAYIDDLIIQAVKIWVHAKKAISKFTRNSLKIESS